MKQVSRCLFAVLNGAMALSMLVMFVLVFGNVVLRYAFNSGITWSEEASRYVFIYMVFLGAIGALKNNEHLGVDILIKKLPLWARRTAYICSNLLMIYTLYLIADGSWKLMLLNVDSRSSATGMPVSYIYAVGVLFSVCMGLILIMNTIRAVMDKNAIAHLSRLRESEEEELLGEVYHGQSHPGEGKHQQSSRGGVRI